MEELPKVSICTPTYNRRPFITTLIKCVEHQTYPKHLIEWVIIDDGTDKIEDLVSNITYVNYYKFKKKMTLGKKRNMLHDKSTGDIMINMDDDDYYSPYRVEHAVQSLMQSDKLCAGCNIMYVWYNKLNKMYQMGPYKKNHCTAASIAFKRQLLDLSSYDENACLSEEKHFLKDYTIDLVELDPLKTILVFSHSHNTYDKTKLLNNPSQNINITDKRIDDFIKENNLKIFFTETIETMLSEYEAGLPIYKPDVLLQMLEMEEEKYFHLLKHGGKSINMKDPYGNVIQMSPYQVIQTLHDLQNTNQKLLSIVDEKNTIIRKLHYQVYNKMPKRDLSDLMGEINHPN